MATDNWFTRLGNEGTTILPFCDDTFTISMFPSGGKFKANRYEIWDKDNDVYVGEAIIAGGNEVYVRLALEHLIFAYSLDFTRKEKERASNDD